jgi:TonB-dependent siderophore receptor
LLSATVACPALVQAEDDWEARLRALEGGADLREGFDSLLLAQVVGQAGSKPFDIPPQPLAQALLDFSRATGVELFFDDALVAGLNSPGLSGNFTDEEALRQLLSGSGLTHRFTNPNTVILERNASGGGVTQLAPLAVQGTAPAEFGDTPVAEGFKADYQSSATKSSMTLRETPQAVTVVTEDSIETRQASDVTTALELSPGVSSGRSSGGGPFAGDSARVADQFSLRGQRLDGDRDVRIDGFASGAMRNEFDLAAFESIEVVRGPSGLLYGQGSLGGFINLIRKKPSDEYSAKLVGQAASFDSYRTEVDLAGPFDENKVIRGQATFAFDDSGSFIDDVESRRYVAAPGIDFRIEDDTRVLIQGLYQHTKFQPSLGIPLRRDGDELEAPDIPRSFYYGVPAKEKSTTQEVMGSIRVDHQFTDKWLGTLQLQRSANTRRGLSDSYGYGIAANGDTPVYAQIVEHENDVWAGELRIDGAVDVFGLEHKLVAGIEGNKRSADSRSGYAYIGLANIYADNFEDIGTIVAGELPITFNNTSESFNKAAYAQVSLGITERARLLGGVRYDEARQTSTDNLTGDDSEKIDSAVTYRVAATYDFTDNITAYAAYATSFNPNSDVSRSGEILDPETGEGYEVGLKTEWFEDQLGVSVALFQQDLDNRAIPDPSNGPGDNFSVNGGLQRTRGVEFEVSGSPYPGVTVGAAATYLDSEYIDPIDPNHGLIPDETTDFQSALYLSYEIQDGDFQGLGLGGTWAKVGKRWAISGDENVYVGGYDRFDLQAFYHGIPGVDLSFQVRNLLDARYIERANGAFAYGHYFGAPRSFMFRGSITF